MTNEGMHEIGAMENKNMLWVKPKEDEDTEESRKYCRNTHLL